MNTIEKIKILNAYKSGQTIEEYSKIAPDSLSYKPSLITREDLPDYDFDFRRYTYKIQKKPKYRPYETVSEFIEDYNAKLSCQYGVSYQPTPLEKPVIFVKGPYGGSFNSKVDRLVDSFVDSFGSATMVHIASLSTSYPDKFENGWVNMKELYEYFTYLDGSKIGKER